MDFEIAEGQIEIKIIGKLQFSTYKLYVEIIRYVRKSITKVYAWSI